jgi:hypothetical protein
MKQADEDVSSKEEEVYHYSHYTGSKILTDELAHMLHLVVLSHSSNGLSVQNTLSVQPTINTHLQYTILHLKTQQITFTAGTDHMCHELTVHPKDRRFQWILWSKPTDDPVKT